MNIEIDNLKKDLINFSESSLGREVCGFILEEEGDLVLKKLENKSNHNDLFIIEPIDFLQAKLSGKLVSIFHSHTTGSEKASKYDIKNAENCLYPYLIYALDTEKFYLFDKPYFERSKECVNKLKGILDD